MLMPDYDDLVAISKTLEITLQKKSSEKDDYTSKLTGPWVLHEEQKKVLKLILENPRLIVLKSRQQGLSTIAAYALMMFSCLHDNVDTCVVADTSDKAKGLLGKISNWLDQMEIPYKGNMSRIKLFNGTTIHAISAIARAEGGESRAARSRSMSMIHVSELSFIVDAAAVFRGLTSTALPGARIVVESTASQSEPNLFKTIWLQGEEGEPDNWVRHFVELETHEVYRADPMSITDEKWAELQESRFGFTRRDTAAWWWDKCRTDFAGDILGCLREYPPAPRACFLAVGGRYIDTYSPAEVTTQAAMVNSRPTGWTEYTVDNINEDLIMGVDVSAGLGGDSSAIAIMGAGTRRIYCTWLDHWTPQPQLVELIKATYEKWKPKKILVESNGVGMGVYLALKQHTKLPIVEQHSSHEKHMRMSLLKMMVEESIIKVGPEVAFEIANSRIAKPSGPKGAPDYQGKDDLLNALSFANKWIENNGPKASPVDLIKKLDPRLVFHRSFLNKKRKECF